MRVVSIYPLLPSLYLLKMQKENKKIFPKSFLFNTFFPSIYSVIHIENEDFLSIFQLFSLLFSFKSAENKYIDFNSIHFHSLIYLLLFLIGMESYGKNRKHAESKAEEKRS